MKIISKLFKHILKKPNYPDYTKDDGKETIFETVGQTHKSFPLSFIVELKDGTQLICRDVSKYNNAPIIGWLMDKSGNIAIYVDKKIFPVILGNGSVEYTNINNNNNEFKGHTTADITIIPKEEIKTYKIVLSKLNN